MARHTNKRRNTRRTRQTRSKRRSQRGGGLFSSKDDDIKELQDKIAKCKKNIPEWEAEITKLQSEQSVPKSGFFSNLFGSKDTPEQEEGASSEPVAPEPVPIKEEGASEQVASKEEGESVPPIEEEGEEENKEVRQQGGRKKYKMNGGTRKRRRHRRK
jgi:hypothetical protein